VTSGDRDDLLFLYVAGALEAPEREEVEEWIASGAPEAFEHLARAAHELALLAAAQPRVAPSAGLRDRLGERIAASRGVRTASPAPARPSALRRLHPALAAGLGAVLAAGVAGLVVHRAVSRDAAANETSLRAELDAAHQELANVEEERNQLDDELAGVEARLRSLESDLVLAQKAIGVLQAEHAESVALAGTPAAPDAHGRVFWDWDEWYCYMRATGLAHDPTKIYAIWLFTEDDVVGVGTFRADDKGVATFLGPVPHDVGVVLRAGVSIEPDEDLGSKPRGNVVMLGAAAPAKPG
jgi:anti-sigma-K factor RskA